MTYNDTNAAIRNATIDTEGSGSHGMYLRVNGVVLWCRGANVVPMDQLEGRLTDAAHRIMVKSARDAHMNMLRVWGGGMILPQAFYDACDENGILVFHDLMFVEEQNHGAMASDDIEDEIRQTIRHLSSHASIVVWSGCNECAVEMGTDTELYATFVMTTVAEEDDTRIVWPSCPSAVGWKTGVHAVNSIPNGRPMTTPNPDSHPPLEIHGPYQHGISKAYPAVNGFDDGRYILTAHSHSRKLFSTY